MPGFRTGSVTYYLCDFGQVAFFITSTFKNMLYIANQYSHAYTDAKYKWKEKLANKYLFFLPWMHSGIFFSIHTHSILIYFILFHFIFFKWWLQLTNYNPLMAAWPTSFGCSVNGSYHPVLPLSSSSPPPPPSPLAHLSSSSSVTITGSIVASGLWQKVVKGNALQKE